MSSGISGRAWSCFLVLARYPHPSPRVHILTVSVLVTCNACIAIEMLYVFLLPAATSRPDGSRAIMDDFREAYYWLRHNTAPDAKVMSWWDYGYQISGMANRTVLVDNNTWNNTHIATVGECVFPRILMRLHSMLNLRRQFILARYCRVSKFWTYEKNRFL